VPCAANWPEAISANPAAIGNMSRTDIEKTSALKKTDVTWTSDNMV
jgi:hypothetical protein